MVRGCEFGGEDCVVCGEEVVSPVVCWVVGAVYRGVELMPGVSMSLN